ncbi:ATP-binding cassette domain-containing protein [Sporosarcina thermotolerans]|uniref:ATP-binding cassette domain-containing protein n=1 Tax=Sporosarcina thermotolerans TaxID=633404 RepID=A0AAW9A3M3_9BACL|nr:ATP-binding cassette domain-containing protein [Sporosarcina thermotolerans]MDW0115452.1 ATP-binding cassette domain-containing protein [Sporosarcina thermotolerans]WHT47220.1 ATP-binding cassette domain-containing protein [Sporosarcina thermotolerans]
MLDVQIKKQLFHYDLEVDFSVGNEKVILFGPSGSGKTTILDSIAGLNKPDSGKICLGNNLFFDQKQWMPTRVRNVGYLFQDYALFPHMTVEKNIYYGIRKKEQNSAIEKILDVLRIHHLWTKFPHQISGGEKQRVALARALATEPSVLLLDEPLSALDKQTRTECQDEILRIHEFWKIPFIIVTHDMDEAEKLGNKIIFLEEGKIIKTTTV